MKKQIVFVSFFLFAVITVAAQTPNKAVESIRKTYSDISEKADLAETDREQAQTVQLVMNELSINSRDHQGRPACNHCGPCQQGCVSGAKASTDMTHWPYALGRGVELRTCAVVPQVVVEAGRVGGVTARPSERQVFRTGDSKGAMAATTSLTEFDPLRLRHAIQIDGPTLLQEGKERLTVG